MTRATKGSAKQPAMRHFLLGGIIVWLGGVGFGIAICQWAMR